MEHYFYCDCRRYAGNSGTFSGGAVDVYISNDSAAGNYIDFENPFIKKVTIRNGEMIDGFATLVESRDNNTGGHIKRTKSM